MGWPKREDSRTVDQNVDVPVSEFHCSSCDFTGARRVLKVKRYKVGVASCCADFRDRLFARLDIAACYNDVDASLREFLGCSPPNPLVPPVISAVDESLVMVAPFLIQDQHIHSPPR